MALLLYGLSAFFAGEFIGGSKKTQEDSKEKNVISTVDRPLPYLDTQSSQVLSAQVKLCSNTAYSFQVAYPGDWFTTYNNKEEECAYFAPYTFIVPLKSDQDFTPIKIEIITLDEWENTVKFYENPNDLNNVISQKNIDINGHSAKKIELASTGTGAVERGFVKVAYLVFDSDAPLVIYYQQLEQDEDVERNIKILEEIAASLKYL